MTNPLSEIGLSAGSGDEISARVEHLLTLGAGAGLEEPARRMLLSLSDSSRDATRTVRIVGYAAATYLILCGVARIIEASRGERGRGRKGGSDGGGRIA